MIYDKLDTKKIKITPKEISQEIENCSYLDIVHATVIDKDCPDEFFTTEEVYFKNLKQQAKILHHLVFQKKTLHLFVLGHPGEARKQFLFPFLKQKTK